MEHRNVAIRVACAVRRKARPLAVTGAVAAGVTLIGAALLSNNLARWLDTAVASCRLSQDRTRVELMNSLDRIVKRFAVPMTSDGVPLTMGDVDGDGLPEVFLCTQARDSPPGTVLCYDAQGRERWRYRGGFREEDVSWWHETNAFGAAGVYLRDVDHDGQTDVFAVFTHTPYCATEIARLTAWGEHVASFWNRGHCGIRSRHVGGIDFADVDRDGIDEVIVAGTLNGCNRGMVAVLNPRRMAGKGLLCTGGKGENLDLEAKPPWECYVLIPDCPEVRSSMGKIPRLRVGSVLVERWNGRDVLTLGIPLDVPGLSSPLGAFKYRLDFDLHVVQFYCGDWFYGWLRERATETGRDPAEFIREFEDHMRRIEVVAGSPDLVAPTG